MSRIPHKIPSFSSHLDKRPLVRMEKGSASGQIAELIEELQSAVRSARERQIIAEEERDCLQSELAEFQRDSSRTHEADARAAKMEQDCDRLAGELDAYELKIQEVTAQRDDLILKQKQEASQQEEVLRARDLILKEQESNLRQLASARRDVRDLQVRMEGVQNQLSEAQKGLLEARQSASGSKKADGEAQQRQAIMLKQARDAAAAQVAELKQRVNALEDAAAEAGYDRDVALRAAEKAAQQLGSVQKENETVGVLQKEIEGVREALRAAELAAEGQIKKSELLAAEVAELQRSNDRFTQERDAARTRVQERESELDQMRASLFTARTEASERAELAKAFEETRALLMDAQRQNEALMKECETFHLQFSETMPVMEARLKEKETENAKISGDLQNAVALAAGHRELLRQHEEQRLATIEISAQLGNAQDEVKELSATLAEARLLARNAKHSKPTPQAATPVPKTYAVKASSIAESPIDATTGKAGISAMRLCLGNFKRSEPCDVRHLGELHAHAHSFSEWARGYGQVVLHRICTAFAAYVEGLFRMPERVTPEVPAKLDAAITFISGLLSEQGIERSVRLCDARVYIVDDDPEAAEIVGAALDCVGLKTRSTTYASAAIADLSEANYDLIVLDLDLPDLDGFELCAHIRKIPHHATTPIIFLTGYESEGNREESILSGGNAFFGKPFSVQELGLNALTHIIQSRLNAA